MIVSNMQSRKGNAVANQFIINTPEATYFKSYNSIIVKTIAGNGIDRAREVLLDEYYWNYSRTTSKYRSMFLGESTEETRAKIKSGEYKLVDLN